MKEARFSCKMHLFLTDSKDSQGRHFFLQMEKNIRSKIMGKSLSTTLAKPKLFHQ